MLINCGLLTISYVLILALFITVLTRCTETPGQSHTATISNLNDLRDYVAELALKLNKMEERAQKPNCEGDWKMFNGSCYHFSVTKLTWVRARGLCLRSNSDLVVINSAEEQSFIAQTAGGDHHWIGLSDLNDEGIWKWVDGTDYENSYKYWKKGEPNDYDHNEDCAIMWNTAEWNDFVCTKSEGFALCERRL
ncbi:hepatic lectin-like isoform 2-T2 [Discoglossus pictus]